MARGHVWQEACVMGGMCDGGHAWQGGCVVGGHVWHGACMVQGMHGGVVCVAGETATAVDGQCATGMHSCFKCMSSQLGNIELSQYLFPVGHSGKLFQKMSVKTHGTLCANNVTSGNVLTNTDLVSIALRANPKVTPFHCMSSYSTSKT